MFFTDNYKYWQRYHRTKDIKWLIKFFSKSKDIDWDIDEYVHWGRCYDYSFDGKGNHTHSFKSLVLSIMYELKDNPNCEIKINAEDFHKDEVKIIESLIKRLKEDLGADK